MFKVAKQNPIRMQESPRNSDGTIDVSISTRHPSSNTLPVCLRLQTTSPGDSCRAAATNPARFTSLCKYYTMICIMSLTATRIIGFAIPAPDARPRGVGLLAQRYINPCDSLKLVLRHAESSMA